MARKRQTPYQGSPEPEDISQEVPDVDELPSVPTAPPPKRRPVHVIKLRNLSAAIWENWGEYGPLYNVTLSRVYRDEQQRWQHTNSPGLNDLLLAAKVLDLAHSWICQQLEEHC
jgi:hypothetical protein